MNKVRNLITRQCIHLKEIISGAGISLFLRLLGAGTQFMFSLLIARLYGTEGLGAYTFALSFTIIASVIGRWGLDQTALKLIAIHAGKGEWNDARRIQIRALKLVILISAVITLLLMSLSQWLDSNLFHQPGLGTLLQMLALAILPFSGLNLIAECLRAVKSISAYTVIQSILVPAVAMIGILLLTQFKLGILSAVYAYVFACYVTFIVALFLWSNLMLKKEITSGCSGGENLIKTATPMAWVAIVATLMSLSETVLLGLFRSSDEIGVYTAALRFATLSSFIIIAFNSVLAPKFAALIRDNKKTMVQQLTNNSVVIMMVAAFPLLGVFIFFPEYILQLFGHDFKKASSALVILAFAQIVNVAMGPAGLLLMMGGHEKVMKKISFCTWLTSTFAGLLLIPAYGAIGAACSAFFGIVMLNILAVLCVRKHMGITLLFKLS